MSAANHPDPPTPAWLDADPAEPHDADDAAADALPPDAATCDVGPLAEPLNEDRLAGWIAAIATQDERALTALYDATFSRVYGLVRRIVRDSAMAEEVVEDAYFQVWRQALRFDPARGRALTWLLGMARSRAIDALRREARFQHERVDAESVAELATDAPALDELLTLARHRADLHQALLRLGAQPRQLVSLAFFRGLSHEEIADQTSLPLGTVKSQIRRALVALRQILLSHALTSNSLSFIDAHGGHGSPHAAWGSP